LGCEHASKKIGNFNGTVGRGRLEEMRKKMKTRKGKGEGASPRNLPPRSILVRKHVIRGLNLLLVRKNQRGEKTGGNLEPCFIITKRAKGT